MHSIRQKRISFILIYALLLSLLIACAPADFPKTETEDSTQASVTESGSESASETPLESESVSETESESESASETPSESESVSETESESESASETPSESESVSETESESESASETPSESESASETESESESASETPSESESASETESESESASETPSESESVSETESETESIPEETDQTEVDFSSALNALMQDPTPLGGDYAYRYLGTLEGGESYRALYRAIDAEMLKFHTDSTLSASDNVAVTVDFLHYGFSTSNEDIAKVLAVFSALRFDRPIYYWIGNQIGYRGTTLTVYSQESYANGEVRIETNELLYKAILAYVNEASSLTSSYEIALAYHDAIVESAAYAYLEDGVTPDGTDDSHSVIGIALKGRGVCESYAELYQALLNYSGIPNVMVVGTASGTPHAWNLVQIDGGWYFCDLTWDDTSIYDYGFLPYFCVTDDERTNVTDTSGTVILFSQTHSHYAPSMDGTAFFYELPERATVQPINSESVTLVGESFICQDGMTYRVTSGDTVCLISSNGKATVHIPETVMYEGKSFTVTMIAALDDDGALTGESVLASNAYVSIFIPKTVRLIATGSTKGATFYAIEVDDESPYYEFKDGYLQSKDA